MSLVNLVHLRFYFHVTQRCLVARSVSIGRPVTVPEAAVYLGEYEHPFPAREVLGDLAELLERLPDSEPEPEPDEPLPPITALEWLHRVPPTKGSIPYAQTGKRRRERLVGGREHGAKAAPAAQADTDDASKAGDRPTPAAALTRPWSAFFYARSR